MAKIQHADLPDQYLHEPKGASRAGTGSVYVANGSGSGEFKLLPVSSLDFDPEQIPEAVITVIPTPIEENGAGLLEIPDGSMSDVAYVTQVPVSTIKQINKNFKELYEIYSRDVQIHNAVKEDVEILTSKLNSLIATLANIGLLDNE